MDNNNKDRLNINIRKKMRNGFSPNEYTKVINLNNAGDMCYLFEDLSTLFDVPIESIFRKYMERKNKGFPF